jgi:hypothetical protein
MGFPQVALELPDWVEELIPDPGRTYPTEEDRMAPRGRAVPAQRGS